MRAPLHGLAFVTAFVTNMKHEMKQPRDERGAAFTEYVVLLAIIVAIIVALLWVLQTPLQNAIQGVADALTGVDTPPAAPAT